MRRARIARATRALHRHAEEAEVKKRTTASCEVLFQRQKSNVNPGLLTEEPIYREF